MMETAIALTAALSRLRDQVPPDCRSKPKRSLLEYYLRHEHAQLRPPVTSAFISKPPSAPNDTAVTIEASLHFPRQVPPACCCKTNSFGTVSSSELANIKSTSSILVDNMCRKAKLKRCFREIRQHKSRSNIDHFQPSGTTERFSSNVDAYKEKMHEKLERYEPTRHLQPVAYHRPTDTFHGNEASRELRVPAEEQPIAQPNAHQEEMGEEEQIRRQILLRQFFHAARPPALARADGEPQVGGAPSFTVGGSTNSWSRGVEAWQKSGGNYFGYDGQGAIGARRADLLRRILQAMRESLRARSTEEESLTASPSPVSPESGNCPRFPITVTATPPMESTYPHASPPSQQYELLSSGRSWALEHTLLRSPSQMPSQACSTAVAPTVVEKEREKELPVHPRQVARDGNAFRAIFQALMRLLPRSSSVARGWGGGGSNSDCTDFSGVGGLGVSNGSDSRDGGDSGGGGGDCDSGVGDGSSHGDSKRMQVAAVRCGRQCQNYIRLLQQGIEVSRLGENGENIPCNLTLQSATRRHTVATLVLRDLESSQRVTALPAGAETSEVRAAEAAEEEEEEEEARTAATARPSHAGCSSMSIRHLPLAHLTRVRCLTTRTSPPSGKPFSFVILADRTTPTDRTEKGMGTCSRRRGAGRRLMSEGQQKEAVIVDEKQEEQGCLQRVYGRGSEGFEEIREEIASFGVLHAESDQQLCALVLGVASVKSAIDSPFRTRQALSNNAPSGRKQRASLPAKTSATATTATTSAGFLPWQGARVAIASLAPLLTFIGAVSAVEAEARRVGHDNGVSLRDQNLLISTDLV